MKPLVEEALPAGLFAKLYYGATPDMLVTPVLGNQPFDATISDPRNPSDPIGYIELSERRRVWLFVEE